MDFGVEHRRLRFRTSNGIFRSLDPCTSNLVVFIGIIVKYSGFWLPCTGHYCDGNEARDKKGNDLWVGGSMFCTWEIGVRKGTDKQGGGWARSHVDCAPCRVRGAGRRGKHGNAPAKHVGEWEALYEQIPPNRNQ